MRSAHARLAFDLPYEIWCEAVRELATTRATFLAQAIDPAVLAAFGIDLEEQFPAIGCPDPLSLLCPFLLVDETHIERAARERRSIDATAAELMLCESLPRDPVLDAVMAPAREAAAEARRAADEVDVTHERRVLKLLLRITRRIRRVAFEILRATLAPLSLAVPQERGRQERHRSVRPPGELVRTWPRWTGAPPVMAAG